MRRLRLIGVVVAAGLGPAGAAAQYPGAPGLPGVGISGGSGGFGGGAAPGYGGYGGGYMGYPIYPFGGGLFSNSGPFAPNAFNRSTQPLSPYLNLLRGGNPAVNYFYGVRPGLGNGQVQGAGMGAPMVGSSQLRTGYLPLAGSASDEPVELPVAGQVTKFPPSSHPVVFGNRFGPNTGSGGSGRPGFFGQQGGGQQQRVSQPSRLGGGARSPTTP
jgi:hypothetical protein